MGQEASAPDELDFEATFQVSPNGKWIETSTDDLINIDSVLTIAKRRCGEEQVKMVLIMHDVSHDGYSRYVSSPVSEEEAEAFQNKLTGRKRKRPIK